MPISIESSCKGCDWLDCSPFKIDIGCYFDSCRLRDKSGFFEEHSEGLGIADHSFEGSDLALGELHRYGIGTFGRNGKESLSGSFLTGIRIE